MFKSVAVPQSQLIIVPKMLHVVEATATATAVAVAVATAAAR